MATEIEDEYDGESEPPTPKRVTCKITVTLADGRKCTGMVEISATSVQSWANGQAGLFVPPIRNEGRKQ